MNPDVWFTSDTHFFHKKIMDFCPTTRIGKDYEEMTEMLVDAWNSCVKPNDTLYHLGDFSFGNKEKTIAILERLNGNIHLVQGNHDHQLESPELRKFFTSFQIYKTIVVKTQRFVLMHYPIESWDRMHHGTIHLHGHVHGNTSHECHPMKNRMDVGVDARWQCDMKPFHFDEVMELMKERNRKFG